MTVFRGLFGFLAATVAVIVLMGVSAVDAWAHGDVTCVGGSIASGTYETLHISGACTVDAGSVTVENDVTVLPGASLVAITGGNDTTVPSSNLTVGGSLHVQKNAILILGCEPVHFICANDPDQMTGTYFTRDRVAGNLDADNALSVIVHLTVLSGGASLIGGGGGLTCAGLPAPFFFPPYGDFEDNLIVGNLTIKNWQSCYLAVIRDIIVDNLYYSDNVTLDPDGNEVVNNSIGQNWNCTGNSPSPQIGDSGGGPSTVFGHANGQCNSPLLVVH
jgi:hypothetical protein